MNDADMRAQPFHNLQHVRGKEDRCAARDHALQHGFQSACGDGVHAFERFIQK